MKKRGIAAVLIAVMVMIGSMTAEAAETTEIWIGNRLDHRPVPSGDEEARCQIEQMPEVLTAIMGNGKPKELKVYNADIVVSRDYVVPNILTFQYDYTYDAQGNMISALGHLYGYNSESNYEYNYEYDDNGRLIRESNHSINSNRESNIIEYTYDSEGRIIMMSNSCNNRQYDYDEQGNIVRDSFNRQEYDYIYDSEGRVIRKNTYSLHTGDDGTQFRDRDNLPNSYEEYSYDEQGRLIRRDSYEMIRRGPVASDGTSSYPKESSLKNYEEYSYNEQGRLIKQSGYDLKRDGSLDSWFSREYSYDSEGNMTRVVCCSEDGLPHPSGVDVVIHRDYYEYTY